METLNLIHAAEQVHKTALGLTSPQQPPNVAMWTALQQSCAEQHCSKASILLLIAECPPISKTVLMPHELQQQRDYFFYFFQEKEKLKIVRMELAQPSSVQMYLTKRQKNKIITLKTKFEKKKYTINK